MIISINVEIHNLTYLLIFNIFVQHFFVQILPNSAKFCIVQNVVGGGFAVMKTNEMQVLYLSVIRRF